MSDHRPVHSTYRVQLNRDFTFDDVARIALYLAELGVTHVYCSPYLQAYPGSTHGYDVVDHTKLNEELGGRAGFDRMLEALEENGLGHIVDIVPNHVSIDGVLNEMWWDVLKHGRDSRYESYFDIDWDTDVDDLTGKVLVPILGASLDEVIAGNELAVETGVEPTLRYFDHRLPLAPGTEDGEIGDVVARQHYLPAFWKRAGRHLNYRRFFDINTLAGLQADVPGVFEDTHGLILELLSAGSIDGLRVDHIDGLRDPLGYLERLRNEGAPYVVVEKILEPGEELPGAWPVDGTTGYDFLNTVAGLFIDPDGEAPLTEIYASQTGEETDIGSVTRAKKMLVMRHVLVADINRLVREFLRAHEGLDEDEVRVAIAETIAALPVYRTYARPDGSIDDADRRIVDDALAEARRRSLHIDAAVFDRLHAALVMEDDTTRGFALRFQQTTGPVMAKGLEDTVFYNYNRLISLNEVGGDPGRFGVSLDEFHTVAENVSRSLPRTMLATSTHDTKRCEDVRARIALLSEIPERWGEAVQRLAKIAARHRTGDLPDRNAEYLFLQTLVGAHPLDASRAGPVHAEGHERSQETHVVARPASRLRPRDRTVRRGSPGRRRVRGRGRCVREAARPTRPHQLARADASQTDASRGSRHLSGHGDMGRQSRRSGQPEAHRLRRPDGSAATCTRDGCGRALGGPRRRSAEDARHRGRLARSQGASPLPRPGRGLHTSKGDR